jgi:hypothetical protein
MSTSISMSMSTSIYRPTQVYEAGEHTCEFGLVFKIVLKAFRLFTSAFSVLFFAAVAFCLGEDEHLRCLYRRYPSQAVPQKQALLQEAR